MQLEPNESKEKVIVFFKVSPEVITPDNLHTNTIVSTMIDSPLSTLYHAVQKIYAPLMLEDGKWSRTLDPKLQSLISELEAGLGSAIRKQDPSFKGKGDNADNLGSMKYIFEKPCWSIDLQTVHQFTNCNYLSIYCGFIFINQNQLYGMKVF